MTIRPFGFSRLLAVLAVAALGACASGDEADDAAEQAAVEQPIDDGSVLRAADLILIEEENIAFNLPWVPGPITRDPSRPTPPVNEVQRVETLEGETFDRVIFHLGEGEVPGYQVSWVRDAVPTCEGGSAVSVAGERKVLVKLKAATATSATLEKQAPGHENLTEMASSCVREGEVEWLLGFKDESQMRVFEMRSPRRFVVDVRHGVR